MFELTRSTSTSKNVKVDDQVRDESVNLVHASKDIDHVRARICVAFGEDSTEEDSQGLPKPSATVRPQRRPQLDILLVHCHCWDKKQFWQL